MPLGRLWSRIVGLGGWNKEVDTLHNVEGDGKPAPGETEATIVGERRPGNPRADDPNRDDREWEGVDPGH